MDIKHNDTNGAVLVLSTDELGLIFRSLRHEAQAVERVGIRYRDNSIKDEADRLRSLADLVHHTRNQQRSIT